MQEKEDKNPLRMNSIWRLIIFIGWWGGGGNKEKGVKWGKELG